MSIIRITNASVINPEVRINGASVIIEDAEIAEVLPAGTPLPDADETYDAGGALLVPGFFDIHAHGAVGYEITDDDPAAIPAVCKAKLEEGVTSYFPTTLTLGHEALAKTMERVALYCEKEEYCRVPGVHLEGPFINPSSLGAQNPAFVRKPDIEEVLQLAAIAPVSEMTFAAEMEGGAEFARQLLENGIVPSCGHSKATYAQFRDAYARGLRHLTRFCKQMSPLHHRDIGLVGAGLLHDDVRIEIICDKVHVSVPMIQLVFDRKPIESILLITDSMRASHLPDGPSSIGGLDVIVKNGEARLAKDGALAGSMLRMNQALRNVVEVTGLPVEDVIQTTSWNQAEELGLGDQFGRIEPGYAADLVLLDEADYSVKGVFVGGEKRL